jgi:arylsulfatase A-like enzyme
MRYIKLRNRNSVSAPILVKLALGILPFVTKGEINQEHMNSQPNIVFLLADDLGWGDLGVTGSTVNRTPHLDQLARDGVLWTQFYVASPVCSPTRASFLTGRFPASLAIHGHFASPQENAARTMPEALDPTVPNLPTSLSAAGYKTAHFGKWHLGRTHPLSDYGFSTGRDDRDGTWRLWEEPAEMSRKVADETIAFIRQHAQEHPNRPFYVQSWFIEPHAPVAPSDEQLRPFAHLTTPNSRFVSPRQLYAATVAELDRNIGRILAALEECGLAGNTLVVFTSDNGPEAPEILNAAHSAAGSAGPFRGRKRSIYEGGVRLPLITRWPDRIAPNQVRDDAVLAAVDFFPTIVALTGQNPLPTSIDGENHADTLLGGPQMRRSPLFWEWRFRIFGHVWNRSPQLAVRDGPWKLLMNRDRSRVELYHLPTDPLEAVNRADEEPATVERLSRLVLQWSDSLPAGYWDPTAGSNDYFWPEPLPVGAERD